jgi:tRNA (guanine37-N1)-methyltransferase
LANGIILFSQDATTWSPTICELVSKGTVGLGPYELVLDYDYWNYCKYFNIHIYVYICLALCKNSMLSFIIVDIISSILPEDVEEIPVGFTQTGHVCKSHP